MPTTELVEHFGMTNDKQNFDYNIDKKNIPENLFSDVLNIFAISPSLSTIIWSAGIIHYVQLLPITPASPPRDEREARIWISEVYVRDTDFVCKERL